MDPFIILDSQIILLQLQCEMEAMKVENTIRESQGKSPAWGEEAFMKLVDKLEHLRERIR